MRTRDRGYAFWSESLFACAVLLALSFWFIGGLGGRGLWIAGAFALAGGICLVLSYLTRKP